MKEIHLNIGEFKLNDEDEPIDLWAMSDANGAKFYFYYIDDDEKEQIQYLVTVSPEVIKILYSIIFVSNMEQNNKSQIFINQPYNSN